MRRFTLALAPLAAAMLIGCEDGPHQIYTPAPPGAGNNWNDGQSPPAVASGSEGFGSSFPTQGRTTLCSADLRRERWGWMIQQPIRPPRFYGGIDMAKDDLWHGLTIEDAETAPMGDPTSWMAGATGTGGLCQSVSLGFAGGCPSGIGSCNLNYWGNNQEVVFFWNVASHLVDYMELNLGFLGTLDAKSPDGMHTYTLKIGDVPKKDGQPFLIDWAGGNEDGALTELFMAAMNDYSTLAGLPFDATQYDPAGKTGATCGASGDCLEYNSAGQWIFGFRPLTVYFVGSSGVPQPAQSTPTQLYNFFSKAEPYSNIPQVIKLDDEGPVALGKPLGATGGQACSQQVGKTFSDFKMNCVQVHDSGGPIDTVNLNKVLYGLSHDFEHFTANVLGINQNFTSLAVMTSDTKVVLDSDKPADTDFAQDWFFDLRAKGHVRNDYNHYQNTGTPAAPAWTWVASTTTGTKCGESSPLNCAIYGDCAANCLIEALDRRGSALVYTEWAREMLAESRRLLLRDGKITAATPVRTLGDAACTGYTGATPNFGAGCTGLEGLMIPAGWVDGSGALLGDFTGDPTAGVDPGGNWDMFGEFYGSSKTPLRPGDVRSAFCVDPANLVDCEGGDSGGNSPFFDAHAWVVRRLGGGVEDHLPTEMQDRRFYFRMFAQAYVKYLKAYSDQYENVATRATVDQYPPAGIGPTKVAAEEIDYESLFFDSPNAGVGNTFDKFEYIDRSNIGKGQTGTPAAAYNYTPWDFEYGVDLIGGNQRYDNYYRRMDREEIAMYSAMLVDKTKTPGSSRNVNITNLFGSSILPGNWAKYSCAIGAGGQSTTKPNTPACGSSHPPVDTTGILAGAAGCGAATALPIKTFINGTQTVCATACNYTANAVTGCAASNQTCMKGLNGAFGCVNMMMDLNGVTNPSVAKPMLYDYQGAWSRTVFSMGHSPIKVHATETYPNILAATAHIPNYADADGGPYTASPQLATVKGDCTAATNGFKADWTADASGSWCYAPAQAGTAGTTTAPEFAPVMPWAPQKPGVGFSFPIDAAHDQFVTTGQLDFTGVLETYLIDYQYFIDAAQPSCIGTTGCLTGYHCDQVSRNCITDDDTVRILAIESADFTGQIFMCQDPLTGDILGVHQYDSALSIVDWLAAHPGGWDANAGAIDQKAQDACSIILRASPYGNYLDYISSKTQGVKLSITQGVGQGRVVDATLYDPGITQAP
jgi:hypothetical protein